MPESERGIRAWQPLSARRRPASGTGAAGRGADRAGQGIEGPSVLRDIGRTRYQDYAVSDPMSGQSIKLPDIPVPGTGVILTNVTVTVEPMLPKDTIQMAIINWIVKNYPPK